MKSTGSILSALAMLAFGTTFAAPIEDPTTSLGWTHEQYLEYLTLDDTTGWSGMSSVQYHNMSKPITGTAPLLKRDGGNQFIAYSEDGCEGDIEFHYENFGCGICIGGGTDGVSGYLYRQNKGGVYPTADWYTTNNCQGSRTHHQGIKSGQSSSCDNADSYGVPQSRFGSALLYQGC